MRRLDESARQDNSKNELSEGSVGVAWLLDVSIHLSIRFDCHVMWCEVLCKGQWHHLEAEASGRTQENLRAACPLNIAGATLVAPSL